MTKTPPNISDSNLPKYAIEIKGVCKSYKQPKKSKQNNNNFFALQDINLAIPRGSLFGLLGPNGAGKSTIIGILGGLVVKSAGTVKVWDIDIDDNARNARAAIGIVPQELNLDPYFSPYELLDLQAGLYGVPKAERRTDEILNMLGLYDKRHSYARSLSGGMSRRLLIGKALVHNPPILVLDEPTAGVDIELRRQLWKNVEDLNKHGITVLLTTHYLQEAEELCDQIAIINKGKLVVNDKKHNLFKQIDSKTVEIILDEIPDPLPKIIQDITHQINKNADGHWVLSIQYQPSNTELGTFITPITESHAKIIDIRTDETDLEDIFLQLTASD